MAQPAPGADAPAGLQDLFALNRVARCDIFTGQGGSAGGALGALFGGHVMAQSVAAGQQTVPDDLFCHSVHGYFLLAGKVAVELLFEVDRVRSGGSFATRVVRALQENKVIFQATMSFHRLETGPAFQCSSREFRMISFTRGSLDLPSAEVCLRNGLKPERIHATDAHDHTEFILVAEGESWAMSWRRHRTKLPDDAHCPVITWMSDAHLAKVAMIPHGGVDKFAMRASLDHSVHFHQRVRADEWLLFHTRTTVSDGARGFVNTDIYTKDLVLAVTVSQEILMRPGVPQAGSAAKLAANQDPKANL